MTVSKIAKKKNHTHSFPIAEPPCPLDSKALPRSSFVEGERGERDERERGERGEREGGRERERRCGEEGALSSAQPFNSHRLNTLIFEPTVSTGFEG
jgi:hypothetical protein